MSPGHRLGIDLGTSHTVGIVAWPDDRVRPLLFDGSPLLPSAVYAEPGEQPGAAGQLLVGRDAVHAARLEPARFEGTPKRRIDDGTVLLGDAEYPVAALITAVLSRVAEEATRVIGGPPADVVLSHPAAWGVSRRLTLLEAAKAAGLGEPTLVPEPVAAAEYFAALAGERFAPGHGVLVYDFGGGTFDASLVVRTPEGYDVRAVDGIDDLGGLDLDEVLVEHTGKQLGAEHAEVWQRLSNPATAEDRRHRRLLWDDARIVKERLSRATTTTLHIPVTGSDVTVTRAAFEELARPMIERTARTTAAVLRWSGLPKQRLAGVFLVGGSSRIPLVTTVLQRELGIAPTVLEQPELVVAEGALRPDTVTGTAPGNPAAPVPGAGAPVSAPPAAAAASATPAPVSAAPVSATPVSATPVSATPVSAAPAAAAAAHAGAVPGGAAPVSAVPASPAPPGTAPVSAMPTSPPPGTAAPAGVAGTAGSGAAAPPGATETTAPLPQVRPPAGGYPRPAAFQAQGYPPAAYQPPAVRQPPYPAPQPAYPSPQPTYPAPQPAYPSPQPTYPAPQPPQGYWQAAEYQPQPAGQGPGVPGGEPARRDHPAPPGAGAPRRRTWWTPFLAGLFVLAVVAAGYALRDPLRTLGGGGGGQAGGSKTPEATQPAYQRVDRPAWLPDGWEPAVQQSAEQLWITADERDNSRCVVTGGDTLQVTRRDDADIVGCMVQAPLNAIFYDVAVEVQVSVEAGCAGVWARTGGKGYVLAVCRNYVDLLHVEGSEKTVLGTWWTGYRPQGAVVGLLVRGDRLSAYVSGNQVGTTVTDPNLIRYGKVNAGGWPNPHGHDGRIAATLTTLRIFAPPASQSGPPTQSSPSPSKSPSKSPSWRPSSSASATPSRTPSHTA